jgi:CBS-domain-containing membrane protein
MPNKPIQHMVVEDVVVLKPEDTVEKAMNLLQEHGVRNIPVVNENHEYLGMFSSRNIIEHLVPMVSFLGESIGYAVGAAPDLAERMTEFKPLKVEQFTDKNTYKITPDTHTMEALRALVKYGSPLPVIDEAGKFVGLISEQKAVESLLTVVK